MRRLAIRQLVELSDAILTTQQWSTSRRGLTVQLSSLASSDTLIAEPRHTSGSRPAAQFRKTGRTPGTLFSLPGEESMLLTFDQKDIATRLHKLGRTGWACQVFDVKITPDVAGATEPITFPALGRQVHMNAATDEIENITLMYCPPDRKVRVKVPLKVYGEEVCPGLKAGGRINWIARTIACIARGDQVPEGFEVDVSSLEIKDKLTYGDLQVPEGVELAVKDTELPILKIMKK